MRAKLKDVSYEAKEVTRTWYTVRLPFPDHSPVHMYVCEILCDMDSHIGKTSRMSGLFVVSNKRQPLWLTTCVLFLNA